MEKILDWLVTGEIDRVVIKRVVNDFCVVIDDETAAIESTIEKAATKAVHGHAKG